MKYAEDFREIARNALKGKWRLSALVGFLAALMGGGLGVNCPSLDLNSNSESTSNIIENLNINISPEAMKIILILLLVLLVWVIVLIVISGAATLGYAVFNLKLIDGEEVSTHDLFSQFNRIGDGFWMNFGVGLYIFLWSILFVVPGIIKSYSYSMTPFIMAENPGMKVDAAITESRRIMDGNKWRLFCLNFSFIGWQLLCLIPDIISLFVSLYLVMVTGNYGFLLLLIACGIPSFIGGLFLRPYMTAAVTAFYREIRFEKVIPEITPAPDQMD